MALQPAGAVTVLLLLLKPAGNATQCMGVGGDGRGGTGGGGDPADGSCPSWQHFFRRVRGLKKHEDMRVATIVRTLVRVLTARCQYFFIVRSRI